MPIKLEIKVNVYFFIKQKQKQHTYHRNKYNIPVHHRELTYHRTPAVSMKCMGIQIQYDTAWTVCFVLHCIPWNITGHDFACIYTHALVNAHWYEDYFPTK